jgi:hypothetical protein
LLFWLIGGGASQNSRLQFELTVGVVLLSAILTAEGKRRSHVVASGAAGWIYSS